MAEEETIHLEQDPLVALYNELAGELNSEKDRLHELRSGRELEEVTGDPSLNYLQGKVTGFEVVMNALQAHIIARRADSAGRLNPDQAEKAV